MAVSAPVDTTAAELLTSIGRVAGAPEYLLGTVTSVVVGPGMTIYIADRQGSTVRAYDNTGEFLGTVGSAGEGPGEFQVPNDLAMDTAGRLWVRDYTRISVFARPADHAMADSLVRTIRLAGVSIPWSARGRLTNNSYFYPKYLFRNGERVRYYYERYDSTGATGDTLQIPPLPNLDDLGRANYPISAGTGRNLMGVNRAPFEPMAVWDLTPEGMLVTSSGDQNTVVEWGSRSDTVRLFELGGVAQAVPGDEFGDSARAFRARVDSIPVSLDRVRGMSDAARNGRLPRSLPFILALQVGDDGAIWLRRWPSTPGNPTVFDVLDRSGRPVRTVIVRADLQLDPAPFISSEAIAGVVIDPDTGVERVVMYVLRDK
jgi:6-bladed beta-propeller